MKKKHAVAAATVGLLGMVAFGVPAQAQAGPPAAEGGVVTPPIIWRGSSVAIVDGDGDGAGEGLVGVPAEDLMSGAENTVLAQNAGLVHLVSDPMNSGLLSGPAGGMAFQLGPVDGENAAAMLPGADDQAGALLGSTMVGGDFNCDGLVDWAVAAPGFTTDPGTPSAAVNAGAVIVQISGGGGGPERYALTAGELLPGESETGDWLGSTLAVGNFNGDTNEVGEETVPCDDLVIGVPGEDVGSTANAGAVIVLPGSSEAEDGGFDFDQDRAYNAGTNETTLAGVAEANDWLGAALATGDFNGDEVDDLAIGVPNEDLRRVRDVGAVVVVPGADDGQLQIGKSKERSSGVGGLAGAREASDLLGGALAAGDFNGDGTDDLAIGVRGEDWSGVPDVGAVVVAKGGAATTSNPVGLLTTGGKELASGGSLAGAAERYDYLGTALAAGDINGDGEDDLVIGTPGEDVAGAANAGAIVTVMGSTGSLIATGSGAEMWQGAAGGLADVAEAGDRLGTSLAVGSYEGDPYADVLIGVSREDVGTVVDAGAAIAVIGSATGLIRDDNAMAIDSRLLTQGVVTPEVGVIPIVLTLPGLPGSTAEAGDLAGGLHPAANAQ